MKKKWFISHPSAGPEHTPTFYKAVQRFGDEESSVEIILPHALQADIDLTKKDIETADLIIAEVSIASTGSGIELGWANAAGKEIIAFHQTADDPSPAVQFVTKSFHPYITEEHILKVLRELL